MKQLNPGPVSGDDHPVILAAVRPSARFHQLGGIGSLLLLYPAHHPLEDQKAKRGDSGIYPIEGGQSTDAA